MNTDARLSRRGKQALPSSDTVADLPFSPTPLEVSSGLVLGGTSFAGLTADGATVPRAALTAVIRKALLRPPCIVSFSGGRDSSAVLAVATQVAREEGLRLPVPFTLRFPGDADANEDEWQTLVVRHLALPDWEVRVLDQEIDWVGPVAQQVLRRHGLLWPPNTHFLLPAVQAAAGGALLTGGGGDQVLSPPVWSRVERVLRGATPLRPRDIARTAVALGPRPIRTMAMARRYDVTLPWLHRAEQRALDRALWRTASAEPVGWGASLRRSWATSRARLVAQRSKAVLAQEHDVLTLSPLDDNGFLRSLSSLPGLGAMATRTELTRALFRDLLPEDLLRRRSKAYFNRSFFGDESRYLAESWDGSTIYPGVRVDEDALRGTWRKDFVDARSSMLLQALWLQKHGS